MWRRLTLAVLTATSITTATAGPDSSFKVVRDINTTLAPNEGSHPIGFFRAGGNNFFIARVTGLGAELWKTDGTSGGTVLVKDINPGVDSSLPTICEFLPYKGELYFPADDGVHGEDLWRTDGSSEGTERVVDLPEGADWTNLCPQAVVSERLIFRYNDGVHGEELWVTDGTSVGTHLLLDIRLGPGSGFMGGTGVIGTDFYFVADDGIHGRELWRSDGTESGTRLVKDIRPGPDGSAVDESIAAGSIIYFKAEDGIHGAALWKSDGTTAGTSIVTDSRGRSPSYPSHFTEMRGVVYFIANSVQVWRSDGTADGTFMVTSATRPREITVVSNKLYIRGQNGEEGSLWVTDGTTVGTYMVREFGKGFPFSFYAVADTLYFGVNYPGIAFTLWRSNGTYFGTNQIKFLGADDQRGGGVGFLGLIGEVLFFTASDIPGNLEIFRTDGTSQGTYLFKEINPPIKTLNSSPGGFIEIGQKLIFAADDGLHGRELWASDGTGPGTLMVKDIQAGQAGSSPSAPSLIDGGALFTADDGVHGREVWWSDGTDTGTRMVADLNPGPGSLTITSIASSGTLALFAEGAAGTCSRLWRVEACDVGSLCASRFDLGVGAGCFKRIFRTESAFFVVTEKVEAGRGGGVILWKTDGTEIGSAFLAGFSEFDPPYHFTPGQHVLFFWRNWYQDYHDSELWRSDGTRGGTYPSVLIDGGFNYGHDIPAGTMGDIVFFAPSAGNFRLWRSDGTPGGTYGLAGRWPSAYRQVGNTLFFQSGGARFEQEGGELWATDGTREGTRLVKNLSPAHLSSAWLNLGVANGTLVCGANVKGGEGSGVWRSDGSSEGTVMVQGFKWTSDVFQAGRFVYLAAPDEIVGNELWVGRASIVAGNPIHALEELREEIGASGIRPGIKTSLDAKLRSASEALARGAPKAALAHLESFQHEVGALKGKQIPEGQAESVLDFLSQIGELLGD